MKILKYSKIFTFFVMALVIIVVGYTLSTEAIVIKDAQGNIHETRIFKFVFKFKNEVLDISEHSDEYNEALKMAAQKCFQYYSHKVDLNEALGVELIDICANPKS